MERSTIKTLLTGRFTFFRLIRSIVFIYVVIIVFSYFYVDKITFLPQLCSYEDSTDIIKIKTKSGAQISALYLPDPNAEFTIIYSHGNAEDIGNIHFILERLNLNGFSVFAYDYQGYGTSEGKPSEKRVYQDIEVVYQYVTDRLNIPADRIIAMGRSVGSAVATHLASQHKFAGLILESPFTSAFRVITRIQLSPVDRFNNLHNIKKINCPVLIIHGIEDRIIPIWHGKKLFEKANEPKFKLWVKNAGHNDDISHIAGTSYWGKIRQLTNAIAEIQETKDSPK